jgi:dTDP-4-amino-4,6-dideoxygalactose transaminase
MTWRICRPFLQKSFDQTRLLPAYCAPSYHLFALLTATPVQQVELLAHLSTREINAVFHYPPLHLTPQGQRFGGHAGQCPVAESAAARIVRLPFHFDLPENELDRVIAAVTEFRPSKSS